MNEKKMLGMKKIQPVVLKWKMNFEEEEEDKAEETYYLLKCEKKLLIN